MSPEIMGLLAFSIGLFMSFVWLAFWLLEDRCEPEPKMRIVLTFISGMAVVALVLPLEDIARLYAGGTSLLVVWALIEECGKVLAAGIFGLWSRAYDEPIDALVYMVTAALGFAAAENALFILNGIQGPWLQSALTADQRFIGATLLHTLASATIGLSIAFAFYKSREERRTALLGGVILAVILHTLFNFFILQSSGLLTFSVFLTIWVGIIVVLFFIERVKHPLRDYC